MLTLAPSLARGLAAPLMFFVDFAVLETAKSTKNGKAIAT